MPCCTSASVRVSMEEVASSKTSTGGSATAARAIAGSWRWPWERLAPSPVSAVRYPSGRRRIKPSALASFAAIFEVARTIAPITARVMTVSGMFRRNMLTKEAAIVTPEWMTWGMLWPMSCRRVSTSLV